MEEKYYRNIMEMPEHPFHFVVTDMPKLINVKVMVMFPQIIYFSIGPNSAKC